MQPVTGSYSYDYGPDDPGSCQVIWRVGYIASDYYPDGSECEWGRDMRRATAMALHRQAKAGGCLRLGPVHQSNGTTRGLAAAVQAMVAPPTDAVEGGVVAILGADWTRVALGTAQLLESTLRSSGALPVALLTSGATSSTLDDHVLVLRTVYSDSQAQPLLVSVAEQLGAPAVAIVASTDEFGMGGLRTLNASLAAARVRVAAVATFTSTDPGSQERVGDACASSPTNVALVARAVAVARASGVGTIFVSATGPSTECVFAAAHSLGMDPSAYTWLATEWIHPPRGTPYGDAAAAAASGYISYIGSPYPSNDLLAFRRRFAEMFGHAPDRFAPYAYDAVGLLDAALRAVSADLPPTSLELNRTALMRALRSSSYGGATGTIAFPPARNAPSNVRIGITSFAEGGEQDSHSYEEVPACAPAASLALSHSCDITRHSRRSLTRTRNPACTRDT